MPTPKLAFIAPSKGLPVERWSRPLVKGGVFLLPGRSRLLSYETNLAYCLSGRAPTPSPFIS